MGITSEIYFSSSLTVLFVLLLAAAKPGKTWKPGKTSRVGCAFNGSNPPREIECIWNEAEHAYLCSGDNFNEWLSTTKGQGLLQAGFNPPKEWDGVDPPPPRFTCTGPERAPSDDVTASDFEGSYEHSHGDGRHRHRFRMDEMLVMTDPDPNATPPPPGPFITFVWPPHKREWHRRERHEHD